MTRLNILKERQEMACHNLMCYSKNLLMNSPKIGYEKEWEKAINEVEILEQWIAELTEEECK